MKKKALSIFVSIVILITSLAGFANVSYAATKTYTSGDLTCTLDTSSGLFTISGNGSGEDLSSKTRQPWVIYRAYIKNVTMGEGVKNIGAHWFEGCSKLETVVFSSTVETIGEKAFYDCTASTYWLNLPESCTTVGANAFNNTNFNYVTMASPSISLQTNSFGCTGYARFFGLHDSGSYAFVKAGRELGYNWYHYCLNDAHAYTTKTVSPTCTEEGYDLYYCPYCDADSSKSNLTSALGHNYTNATATDTGSYLYTCSRCGLADLEVSSIELMTYFYQAISNGSSNTPFMQSNYLEKYDMLYDGFVNAKDFLLICRNADKISVANKKTTVDTATTYQTIDGFGASAAWWAQDIGRWDSDKIDVVTELLYGESGAGLDIYRYNLGGGSEDDTSISDWRRRAEDFLSPSSDINDASTYDWTADSAAQKVLASAQRVNSDLKVTLFSNTAPTAITTNGKGYCSNGSTSNLSESNYQSFANYIINCAEHFISEGYNVTTVSPINEPEWEWAADSSGNCSQEGSHWEYAAARTFYNNYMVPALQSSSLNGKVDLSVWESGQLNHSSYWNNFLNNMFSSASSYSSNNANIRSYVDSLDTHSYWASTGDRQTVASQLTSSNYSAIKKVRCTEFCQMTNDGNSGVYNFYSSADNGNDGNGMSIYYGLALADIMYQDLTILNACEWDWWTACSGGVYPDGLVYVDYDDPDNIQTSKRLWAMGNYARFIEEGAVRVAVSTESSFGASLTTEKTYGTDKKNYIEQSAYQNPDGSIVVVYINNSDTDEFTTFGDAYTSFETYVTDGSRNLEKYQCGGAQNTVIHIPSMSITTVVLK